MRFISRRSAERGSEISSIKALSDESTMNRRETILGETTNVNDDLFRRVLSALGGVLGAVGPVARKSAAVGGDKGIDEVLHLPDAR